MNSRVVLTLVVLAFGLVAGGVAPTARAANPYVIDIQECGRNGGQATVPAGVPVSVEHFAFVTGTHGLMLDVLNEQQTTQGVQRGGTLTLVDVTDQWSEPEQLGANPARGWITRLPNIELDPFQPGEVVGVGSLTEFTGPIEIVFPPVGQVDFGPFHIRAGDDLFNGCELTTQ